MASTSIHPAVLLIEQSDANMRLVAQCGAQELVAPYPGDDFEATLPALCARAAANGLTLSVIERFIPHQKILQDLPGRDEVRSLLHAKHARLRMCALLIARLLFSSAFLSPHTPPRASFALTRPRCVAGDGAAEAARPRRGRVRRADAVLQLDANERLEPNVDHGA